MASNFEDRIARRKRGPLSAEERAEIERLAASMKNPRPGKIAVKLNRLSATVNAYMLRNGLVEKQPAHAARVYTRCGRIVHPYSHAQDRRIVELRTEGKLFREIAAIVSEEFGIARSMWSIQTRMLQLACAPEGSIGDGALPEVRA